jgi:hypothetical protein
LIGAGNDAVNLMIDVGVHPLSSCATASQAPSG